MLRPLPVPVLEQLAGELTRVPVKAGEVVFEAGDRGEDFYVIASGTVDVVGGGRIVRSLGVGDGFGEIALLGNGRRTMTVRATEDAELCAISSAKFLPAVSGISGARAAAEATRWSYLNHTPGSAAGELEAS
jgi:CRP-like cAMP-binding protein